MLEGNESMNNVDYNIGDEVLVRVKVTSVNPMANRLQIEHPDNLGWWWINGSHLYLEPLQKVEEESMSINDSLRERAEMRSLLLELEKACREGADQELEWANRIRSVLRGFGWEAHHTAHVIDGEQDHSGFVCDTLREYAWQADGPVITVPRNFLRDLLSYIESLQRNVKEAEHELDDLLHQMEETEHQRDGLESSLEQAERDMLKRELDAAKKIREAVVRDADQLRVERDQLDAKNALLRDGLAQVQGLVAARLRDVLRKEG